MVFENLKKLSFLIVQSVVVVVNASYYQKEYSGYLFTTASYYSWEGHYQSAAQYRCNQNGSDLLAITNSSIQKAVMDFLNDAISQNQLASDSILTDGKRTVDIWRWINGTSTSPVLSIGGQGISTDYALSYGYLYKETTNFTLLRAKPTDTNCYICEFAGQTSCVNGYWNQNQCFQSISDEYVTWFEARNRCLMKGGDLATFEFIITNDGLNSLNGSWINPSTKYWIGLRRQWWTWQSIIPIGSDVTYSQWADGQPQYYSNDYYDCICLGYNDWKWRACRCGDPFQFVCIRASSSPVSTTTRSTPDATTLSSNNQSSSTFNNFTSQSSSSTTAIQNGANAPSSASGKGANDKLAIGLGVGLGGGLLLIIILIIASILLTRKGYISFPRKSTTPKDVPSSPPNDFSISQPPDAPVYAPICPSTDIVQDDVNDSNPTSPEYAPLQIVNISNNSKHHTLAPPSTNGEINTVL